MIEKVIATLSLPGAWTQAAYARTVTGRVIGPACDNAVCFCLEGAGRRVAPEATEHWRHLIGDAILELFPQRTRFGSIPAFNDHEDTTHEDVLAVLNRARDLELRAA